MLIKLVIEDWEGTELLEEEGKHYLLVPEKWKDQLPAIAEAVTQANPTHNYQVHID